ncbi:MAG: UDP-N-acetylglucosamine 2-epimerase (non-hydrolyzing) [Bacteroidetes bacterium]|nr:UDP-N-acetylglucosamine 2-epimerase (non-hydrolyzing) [Bacteroidota bacterium]
MKIVHIVGNRPQFIKLALLYKALDSKKVQNIILHSGQHFDRNMSDVFFDQLNIPIPNYSLGINNLSHNEMIGKMMTEADGIIDFVKPDCVIVYGDTNTTLAGALAAKKRNILVAHIEAGVRTSNETMPEEANRYLTDRISNFNFCCTDLNVENLRKEGFFGDTIHSKVYNSGDLMLDASISFKNIALKKAKLPAAINLNQPFVLTTIHRTENTENLNSLQNIVQALNEIHQHEPVIFPMHPKTKMLIDQHKIPIAFTVLDPMGYMELLALTQHCSATITDSGGLSRESFFFQKRTLVIMQNPFWPEIFAHGNCMQSNGKKEEIITKYQSLLTQNKSFDIDVFGDGKAAEKISDIIVSAF